MMGGQLRRKLHTSWLIAWMCVGIVIGVALARLCAPEVFNSVAWLASGSLLCCFALIRSRVWMILVILAGGVLIGVWRGAVETASTAPLAAAIGQTVTVRGTVTEDADKNQRGQLVLRLSDINVNGKTSEGSLWVTLAGDNAVQRSDSVTLRATLQKGFGNFTAVMYRAEVLAVQRPQPGDIALKARDAFATGVQAAVSEPESSLGLGYLVGMRRGLPTELDTALVAAGLTHIVVASGYNLTILVRLARRIFEKISKYLSFLSAATMIAGFIAVTGMSPSMSRAGLVAGLSLLAWYYGRRIHPLVLLPLAMAITVLVQPSYAWGDLGWQLSFAAFAGVLIGAPLIQAYFFGDKKEQSLRRILVETMAAQIWTLPILLLSFGSISVVAPLANMLILPLVPLAMLLTFVAGMSGLMFPESSQLFGFPAELILTYMTKTAEYVGGLSWATHQLQISLIGFVGMYAVIILFTVYMQHKTQLDLQKTSLIE